MILKKTIENKKDLDRVHCIQFFAKEHTRQFHNEWNLINMERLFQIMYCINEGKCSICHDKIGMDRYSFILRLFCGRCFRSKRKRLFSFVRE